MTDEYEAAALAWAGWCDVFQVLMDAIEYGYDDELAPQSPACDYLAGFNDAMIVMDG